VVKPKSTQTNPNQTNAPTAQPMYFSMVTSVATFCSLMCFVAFVGLMWWKGMLVL